MLRCCLHTLASVLATFAVASIQAFAVCPATPSTMLTGDADDGASYYTHPIADDVKTLQVIADDDFMKLPVIDNSSNSSLRISFDILSDEVQYLQYYIVHCDAGWQRDDLSELDYADGFMPVRVTDVTASFNTFVNYWHYCIDFPNEDVALQVSGNYAVVIHPEDDADAPVAVACFSVTEQMAFVCGEVSGNTDIDYRQEHQQLTLQCTWSASRLPNLDPAAELMLAVTQNHRPDTRRIITTPSRMAAGQAWYEHNGALIYEAGNTFRRFEFIDRHYATLGIEALRYDAPYYEVLVTPQQARSGSYYRFDQDQHGHYLVHSVNVSDEDTECEYFWANFRLAGAMPPKGSGGIYLTGDFTYGELTDACRMTYDVEEQCFKGRVLLKQGHYNYQFITGGSKPSLAVCEGNYYETHNQYDIYVYYRGMGARYDRLLGVARLEN